MQELGQAYQPETIEPNITDGALRRYARPDPAWDRGDMSEMDKREIIAALPDMASELLSYRLAERHACAKPTHHSSWIAGLVAKLSRGTAL